MNSRWRILRRNPSRPGEFFTILNVEEPDGSFRPLDRRTVVKLYEMDVTRQHPGRDFRHMGRLVETAIQEGQAELDRVKAKDNAERMRQAKDEFHFGIKKLERQGKV